MIGFALTMCRGGVDWSAIIRKSYCGNVTNQKTGRRICFLNCTDCVARFMV